jgi:alkanesulfonate monooxygenase SsuD/methylene tetrahydromethanopterin reductase-like flavin-dependent oxidoreductase (luciferase family)
LLVTALTYRHLALLAKQTVTVDHLSGGRLEFGIGSGWSAVEQQLFASVGRDHPVAGLAKSLDVMRLRWAQQQSNFEGQYSSLRDAVGNPRPIQQPAPPTWIGAAGPAMLRLAARNADVWKPAANGPVLPSSRQSP